MKLNRFFSVLEPQVKFSIRATEHEVSTSQMTYHNYLALSGSLSRDLQQLKHLVLSSFTCSSAGGSD